MMDVHNVGFRLCDWEKRVDDDIEGEAHGREHC